MERKEFDCIIVGSGAAGATLARELGRKGKEVLVIETGKKEEKVGTLQDSFRYFDSNNFLKVPAKSKEGVILWRTLMAGGSTVVSCGNATRCLEEELGQLGITLDEEFSEAEADMEVAPISEKLLSEGSKSIRKAAHELGYEMELMPKFINPGKCRKCGNCSFGCRYGAKWTSLNYLEEAESQGAAILFNSTVEKVLRTNGRAKGVKVTGAGGETEYFSKSVVLAAGGLGTPQVLQNSGVTNAAGGLFMDLLVNTYGVNETISQKHEPTMALVDREFYRSDGFILSPFIQQPRLVRYLEMGLKGFRISAEHLIGVMTKTRDEPAGQIFPDGSVSKPVTEKDRRRLNMGSEISREILIRAGAKPGSIAVTGVQGAHPGGCAAVGEIVDSDLQTEIDNLFVCDSSVLPASPGMPPILTIVALAKRLAKMLA